MRKGYKKTEIGVIPEDWEIIEVGEKFVFKNGLNKAKEFFGYGTPIINYMDVFNYSSIYGELVKGKVQVTSDEKRNYEVKIGDVLFTRTSETPDEIGISTVLLESIKNVVFSGFVLRARPLDESIDNEFKKYCFSSSIIRRQIISTCSYTTRALTNGKLLSNIQIPLPPLPEQTAIATVLSDTDNLIQSLEKQIAKKRLIKQGAMQKLLKPKEGWEVKKLGEIAEIKTGSKNNQDKVSDGKYPFFVRSQTIERLNTFSYDCEAILIPGEGGIGSIYHYINGKFDVHQRVYKISAFNARVSGKFIYLYMMKNFNAHAMKNSVKATVDSLRLPTFLEFEINFPTKQEQTHIATILSDMDNEIETLESKLAKYKDIKQGLMQVLLTGKIRVV